MSKPIFWAVVVAVAVNALLGCLALLFGDLEDEGATDAARILMTSFSFTTACFVGLPGALAIGEKRGYVLAGLGVASCIAAEAMILTAVWAAPDSDGFLRALFSVVVLAGATSIANLLWNGSFSWGRHSLRRAWLLWLAVAAPMAIAVCWLDDAVVGAKLAATIFVLAITATVAGLLWNDKFNPRRHVVRSAWLLWLAFSTGLTLYAMWFEDDGLWFHSWGSSLVLAVALAHFSLVMMAKLDRRFVVVKIAALVCNALIAAIALYAVWGEDFSSGLARVTGALIVLAAAFTVLVPVLQRRSGSQAGKPDRTSFCPNCGAFLNLTPGDAACDTCGARFRVEFKRSQRMTVKVPPTIEPLKSVE